LGFFQNITTEGTNINIFSRVIPPPGGHIKYALTWLHVIKYVDG
jgi:hypothetical protein